MSIAFWIGAVIAWLVVVAVVVSLCEAGAKADRKRWELESLAAADEELALSQSDDLFIWGFLSK